MVLTKLFRLSGGFANPSFCGSDISRVQLKSNWTVGEKFLVSDQEAVRECRLTLLKGQWTFFQCLISKLIHLDKKPMMEFLVNADGTHETLQTVRWSCEPIILWIRHFESPTEVQLNSWWKVPSLWSRSS